MLKLIPGVNDLATTHPALVAEWHPTKNGTLTPVQVTAGSNLKVWWQCEHGHEWQAMPNNRRKGVGCPYCAGKKVTPGYNDLATVNPELAKEWHPTKNGELKPSDVQAQSNKKVWWLCPACGHEWTAQVSDRFNKRGCPICSKSKRAESFNKNQLIIRGSLQEHYPEIAAEWHPTKNGELTPAQVLSRSDKKVWWLGKCGHEWLTAIKHRTKGGGCPYCAAYNRRVLSGENDLATTHPELTSEWHPTKNGSLLPSEVMSGSTKKVWWLGSCGHEWYANIYNRSRGNGCPVCSTKKATKTRIKKAMTSKDSFQLRFPELAKEWHPTKNGTLTPEQVTHGSNKKVWWRCTKGHEWQTSVWSRIQGHNCPYCSGFYPIVGETDLATVNPDLAAEWHPTKNGDLTPQDVTAGNGKKVWWQCANGHEWKAAIYSRSSGNGCPYCSGRFVIPGETDLATKRPELVKEWHPTKNGDLTPDMVSYGSGKKVWWVCSKGHEWQALVSTRFNGCGCPVCFGEAQTSFPEQAVLYYFKKITVAESRNTEFGKEIDVWLPNLRVGIEYNGYWHRTEKKQKADLRKRLFFAERDIRIITIVEGSRNIINGDIIEYQCPKREALDWAILSAFKLLCLSAPIVNTKIDEIDIYSQYIESERQNSLAIKYPDLAAQWHPIKNSTLTPEKISAHSKKRIWWQCSMGHEWQASVGDRATGTGCPICSNRKILIGFNDLASTHPDVAAEWHPIKNGDLTPKKVVAGTDKKVWWLGQCGHEWQATINSRVAGRQCPYCAGKKVLPGFNDLQTLNSDLAKEWHPTKNGDLTPNQVRPFSNKKVWWFGSCGHEWQASPNSRSKGTGCPVCSGRKVLPGFNDLASLNPSLATEWHPTKNGDLMPSQVTSHLNKKVWWRCSKGHEWNMSIDKRTLRGQGCPYCFKE